MADGSCQATHGGLRLQARHVVERQVLTRARHAASTRLFRPHARRLLTDTQSFARACFALCVDS